MRFFFILVSLWSLSVTIASPPVEIRSDVDTLFKGRDLSAQNSYGAPIPPWIAGSKPGWYYGKYPLSVPELPCLTGVLCIVLHLLPFNCLHCPFPSPPAPHPGPELPKGYTTSFLNLTGAIEARDYLTYGLVDTVPDCKQMCDDEVVKGCKFVNSYHDVNGKGNSTKLTCALFKGCHNASEATNIGGQPQPNSTLTNHIENSAGYCKMSST